MVAVKPLGSHQASNQVREPGKVTVCFVPRREWAFSRSGAPKVVSGRRQPLRAGPAQEVRSPVQMCAHFVSLLGRFPVWDVLSLPASVYVCLLLKAKFERLRLLTSTCSEFSAIPSPGCITSHLRFQLLLRTFCPLLCCEFSEPKALAQILMFPESL